MLHACVRRFDVTGTVEKILETKQGLIGAHQALQLHAKKSPHTSSEKEQTSN